MLPSMTVAARLARRKKLKLPRPPPAVAFDPRDLLAWYDRHRRVLPWRARGGARPDAYKVWLSEIMLQQTTVTTVAPYYTRLLVRWPTLAALARAPLDDVLKAWAGLGYYARARHLHACAKVVVEHYGGAFPPSEAALRALPGVGAYTAAAIAAIAFDAPALPIDGNVERVVARLFAIADELPAAKAKIRRQANALLPRARFGDFAQALMDLGATVCTPKKPACAICPWREGCAARRQGDPQSYPRKAPKREGRLRRGAAYVALRADGAVLVRTRPIKGLLGGMTEVPGSAWEHDFDARRGLDAAPKFNGKIAWHRIPGVVTHVFTHFPLRLVVYVGAMPRATAAPKGARWVHREMLAGEALPTVMRKVLAHALE